MRRLGAVVMVWLVAWVGGGLVAWVAEGEGCRVASVASVRSLRNGIAGWLAALLPLVVVNALGYAGVFDTSDAFLAGVVALVGSPLLGAAVVGFLGGRPERESEGGASGALVAGLIAGALYLASLLGLVVAAAKLDAEPELLAAHPIRVALAAVCLSCVLVVVGLGVAALVGRWISPVYRGQRAGSTSSRRRSANGRVSAARANRTLASAASRAETTRARAPMGAPPSRPMSHTMSRNGSHSASQPTGRHSARGTAHSASRERDSRR